MTLDDFTALLTTYGSDFGRWPGDRLGAAKALMAVQPEARSAWQHARRLDALFARDRERPADPARHRAIADQALRRIRIRPERGIDWRWLVSRPVGALLAGTLLAGWLAGTLLDPPMREVSALAALFGYGGTGLEGVM